jgi:hypothetical protein
VLERLFSLKKLGSTCFYSRRRSTWSLRQRPFALGEWGLPLRTLSTSRFGLIQSRLRKDLQGRQMRTAQRPREPGRVSGQNFFSLFTARSNEFTSLLLWKSCCVRRWSIHSGPERCRASVFSVLDRLSPFPLPQQCHLLLAPTVASTHTFRPFHLT